MANRARSESATGALASKLAALVFGSGACALVYQVACSRAAAGLRRLDRGLGGGARHLHGRPRRRRARLRQARGPAPNPLALYARLELGIALVSALTPLFFSGVRYAYVAVGGTPTLGLGGGTVARLVLRRGRARRARRCSWAARCRAAAQAVTRAGDVGRRDLAVLYGANTLGAVAGATLVDLRAARGARHAPHAAARRLRAQPRSSRCSRAASPRAAATRRRRTPRPRAARRRRRPSTRRPRGARRASSSPPPRVVGFAFLLMELVWYRMLGPLLGGSSYTFGLILAVALVGIGARRRRLRAARRNAAAPTLTGFALTCAARGARARRPVRARRSPRASGARRCARSARSASTASSPAGPRSPRIVVFPAAFVVGRAVSPA